MIADVWYMYCTWGSHRDALMLNRSDRWTIPATAGEKKHRKHLSH